MFSKLVGFFKQAATPLSNANSQTGSQNPIQINNKKDLQNKENKPDNFNNQNTNRDAEKNSETTAANYMIAPQIEYSNGFNVTSGKFENLKKRLNDFKNNYSKECYYNLMKNCNENQVKIAQMPNQIDNNSPIYLTRTSNNFYVTTNEESLNLNDNTGENYLKSIISSDSIIDEIGNPKNQNKIDKQVNNDAWNTSNMFNDDSINRALRENVNYNNNNYNVLIPPAKNQAIENKSKNNFNIKLNKNGNIPLLNVEAINLQIANQDSKTNNQSKNLNNVPNINQNYSKKNVSQAYQVEINPNQNFNSKNQTQNNSKNQIANTINTNNLYKQPIDFKNNSKNNKALNAFAINNNQYENKEQKKNQINFNTALINNKNKNHLDNGITAKANNNKLINKNNNNMIVEESKETENKKETPFIARNYKNPELNFYTNYICENKWTINDFEIGKKLGSGRFGKVYLVREKKNQFICAIKMIFKSQIISNNLQAQIRRELEIHSHLEHENILKFYGFFWDERRIYLILEYAPGGELYRELKNSPSGRFSEEKAGNYIYQMTKALIYLHSKHVIHRDIKPENMLNSCGTIKLSDFGWSSHTMTSERRTFCGTLDYLCPEMVNNLPHDFTVDIWCLGILCYEFVTGAPPFESSNRKETFRKIKDVCITFPQYLSFEVQDLIMSLLNKVPQRRLSLEEVLQHPWILRYKDYKFE